MKKNPDQHKTEEDKGNSRRHFLQKAASISGAALLGGAGIRQLSTSDSEASTGKKESVLTQSGKLAVVDTGQLDEANEEPSSLPPCDERARQGMAGKDFVMVIDLARCNNARRCVEECQRTHALRGHEEYISVYKMQDNPDAGPYWSPMPCFHCDDPPCTKVCPVDATFKRDDGLVLIDNERCIGCRYCMAACPYNARIFNWGDPDHVDQEELVDSDNCQPETSLPRRKGTVDKCDFCADMLREGELPHCVTACPNGVYYFGDRNEDAVTNGTTGETVRLSELLRERAGYRFMEKLGTKPRVYYLPERDRRFPFHEDDED